MVSRFENPEDLLNRYRNPPIIFNNNPPQELGELTLNPMTGTSSDKLITPKLEPYIIRKDILEILKTLDTLRLQGKNLNVLITGKQGSGKSSLVNQYCATRNLKLATIEIGRLSEASQIFGYMEAKDGNTHFVPGLFLEAITTPGCVVHLQELNRPENDNTLNSIFSVLDDTFRHIWIDELGKYIEVASGVTFFATLNEGFEFIGTLPLDLALRNRFHIRLDLGYLPNEMEVSILLTHGLNAMQATELVTFLDNLRNNRQEPVHVSIRDSVNIAKLMSGGLSMHLAIKASLGAGDDMTETLLLQHHLQGSEKTIDTGYVMLS